MAENDALFLIVAGVTGCMIACPLVMFMDWLLGPRRDAPPRSEHVEYLMPDPAIPGDDETKRHARVLAIRRWEREV